MPIVDLEDAMQSAAAIAGSCDLIVTRDEKGFIHSPIPAISPEDFLLSR